MLDLQIGSRIFKKMVLLVLSRPSITSSKGRLFTYLFHCEGCFQSTPLDKMLTPILCAIRFETNRSIINKVIFINSPVNDCDTVALIMYSSRNFVIDLLLNYMKLKYGNILKFCTLHTTFHYNFIIEKFVDLHISFKLHLVKNWPVV